MKQILIIHGGNSFSSYQAYIADLKNTQLDYDRLLSSHSWRSWIADRLPKYDVLTPTMPNSSSAQFEEWKIYFEKILPFMKPDYQIVGHSLGGMFLAKYLQSHPLKTKAKRIILIAPGYDDESKEDMGSFRVESATKLPLSSDEIHLFHSKNDPVVPYSELAKYQKDLPTAITHSFTDKYHFWDPTFPELLNKLKK